MRLAPRFTLVLRSRKIETYSLAEVRRLLAQIEEGEGWEIVRSCPLSGVTTTIDRSE